MWKTVLAVALLSGAAAAQEYFPLDKGNVWIYRSGEATRTVEISDLKIAGDHTYFALDGSSLVRVTENGDLVALEQNSGGETIWVRFNAPEGESYRSGMGPCPSNATIASRAAPYTGPIGTFNNALRITYSGGTCADAGLIDEFYLPWVGLVQRTETTIAGPRTFDLIYARLGGVTVVSASELSFSVTLDKSTYTANLMPPVDPKRAVPAMTARISLRHSQPEPLKLTFSSGQTYELVIKDESGKEVYRWSDGQMFTQALREVEFPAGEKNWMVTVRLAGRDGNPLPQGKYTTEAWLTTTGTPTYRASVPFEMRHLF